MGQRRRHHVVARFLLARFAAKVVGDKSFVWRITNDAAPKLLSTRDVAVQSNFYGAEEEGLEDALSRMEGRWSTLLRRVDAGESLAPLADDLWHMVYLMGYRAAPIRSAFLAAGEQLIDHLHDNADSPHIKAGILTHLDESFERQLAEIVAQLPAALGQLIWDNRQALKEHVRRDLERSETGALMRDLLALLMPEEALQRATKRGHNSAVSNLIAGGSGPAAVRPVSWRVINDATNSIILGDCPVIATADASERSGAPWKFGRGCRAYYMPISPCRVLVGLRYPGDALLAIDDINAASAELSERCVFAASADERTHRWSAIVARRWMPLDDVEIGAIMDDLVKTFGRDAPADDGRLPGALG